MAFRVNWSLLTPNLTQRIRGTLNQTIRSHLEVECNKKPTNSPCPNGTDVDDDTDEDTKSLKEAPSTPGVSKRGLCDTSTPVLLDVDILDLSFGSIPPTIEILSIEDAEEPSGSTIPSDSSTMESSLSYFPPSLTAPLEPPSVPTTLLHQDSDPGQFIRDAEKTISPLGKSSPSNQSVLHSLIDDKGISMRVRIQFNGNMRVLVRCLVQYTVNLGGMFSSGASKKNSVAPPLRLTLPVHAELSDVRLEAVMLLTIPCRQTSPQHMADRERDGSPCTSVLQIMILHQDGEDAAGLTNDPSMGVRTSPAHLSERNAPSLGEGSGGDSVESQLCTNPLLDFNLVVVLGSIHLPHGYHRPPTNNEYIKIVRNAIERGCARRRESALSNSRHPTCTTTHTTTSTRSFSSFNAVRRFNALSSSLFVAVASGSGTLDTSRNSTRSESSKTRENEACPAGSNTLHDSCQNATHESPPTTCVDETVLSNFLKRQILNLIHRVMVEPNALTINL